MKIEEVKRNLNCKVIYKNSSEYVLTACIIRKNEKTDKYFYQAELRDIIANSVIICRLIDISPITGTGKDGGEN